MKGTVLAFAGLLALCTATPSGAQTTVKVFANSVHQAAFQGSPGDDASNLQKKFEGETGIKVVWETVPYPQMRQTLLRSLSSSRSPYDVVMVENSWAAPDLLSKLLPIEAAKDEGLAKDLSNVFPGMLATFTVDQKVLGVPIRSNPQIVHYNTEVFKAQNLSVPKTYDELLKTAEAATVKRADGAQVYGLGIKPDEDLIAIVKALGGDVLTSDYKVVVNSPENAQTLARIKELFDKGAIPPNFFSMDANSLQTLMREGLVAMTFFGDNYHNRFNDPKSSRIAGKVGFFPAPGKTPDTYAPVKVAYWAAALPRNGQEAGRDAALKLIAYLVQPETQLQMAINGNGPVRKDTLSDPKFQEQAPYASASAIALANSTELLPIFDGTPQVRDAFNEEAIAAVTGKKSISAALSEAEARIRKVVEEKRSN
jgi:multiple sugar transport system substrate-binding protein